MKFAPSFALFFLLPVLAQATPLVSVYFIPLSVPESVLTGLFQDARAFGGIRGGNGASFQGQGNNANKGGNNAAKGNAGSAAASTSAAAAASSAAASGSDANSGDAQSSLSTWLSPS